MSHTEALVFRTPGLIDLRSFTVMGFNAKPMVTNPIGFFGTGLKYSVAVLLRLGCKMVVYIGKDKYTFYAKKVDFRGKEFEQVWMRAEKWKLRARNIELPFTTEYGKNWEPWMVFRELESNTRDENGTTFLVLGPGEDDNGVDAIDGHTTIMVDHPGVIEAFRKSGDVFMDEEEHPIVVEDFALKVREGGGQHLFYRGIRAKDTSKPTLYSYDFINTHGLTEDRTLRDEFWARYTVGTFVATCDDPDVIRTILTADDGNWEHGLEIPKHTKPSDTFHRVMAERPRGISSGVHGYYQRHDPRPVSRTASPWQERPRPWRVDGNVVVDASGEPLFEEPSDYSGRWEHLAQELVRVGNVFQQAPGLEEVTDE